MLSAGVWVRLKAFIWDYSLILLYLGFVFLVSTVLWPDIQLLFTGSVWVAQLSGFLIVTLPVSLYFALGDSRLFGGTSGKRKLGIRVIDSSRKVPGVGRSIWRVALKFLPWELSHFLVYRLVDLGNEEMPLHLSLIGGVIYALMIAYIVSAYLSKNKQSVYDRLSGTRVVLKEKL